MKILKNYALETACVSVDVIGRTTNKENYFLGLVRQVSRGGNRHC